jgi:dihydropyrimidine dehydrogenase (NAD+) subunit PreT
MTTSALPPPPEAARACGLHAGRLNLADYARNFADAHPPLTAAQALIEAERCYYCFDAPCITACPTGIDIPSFIARIAQGNTRGAAKAILQANPLGGMCARVCPTEVLCEQACVRNTNEDKPVEIGALQRVATDAFFANPGAPLFSRAAVTGKKVAVVGAGPAGLACAHGLALHGHDVVLFEARAKPGGLNEYGIAAYKTADGFAQQEVQWLLSVGGIELRCGQQLGRDFTLDGLRADFDAVFLGLGLGGVNALGVPEPADAVGLRAAVDFISDLRQAGDLSQLPVGRHVLVIGGGMTAVDAAVQAKLLGAETSTIVYRRGAASMPASEHEQDWAKKQGVTIRHWAAPVAVLAEGGAVSGVTFAHTELQGERLVLTQDRFTLEADMVLRAIGQTYLSSDAGPALALKEGRITTNAHGQTNLKGVWAGGDCRHGGRDLTVEAVEHGKLAAQAMHRALMAG